MTKTLADVLDRMAAVAQSVMDGGAPSDDDNDCPMCLLKACGVDEHDPDCGYRIARHMSQADLNEVRRLARVLRYDGRP